MLIGPYRQIGPSISASGIYEGQIASPFIVSKPSMYDDKPFWPPILRGRHPYKKIPPGNWGSGADAANPRAFGAPTDGTYPVQSAGSAVAVGIGAGLSVLIAYAVLPEWLKPMGSAVAAIGGAVVGHKLSSRGA